MKTVKVEYVYGSYSGTVRVQAGMSLMGEAIPYKKNESSGMMPGHEEARTG